MVTVTLLGTAATMPLPDRALTAAALSWGEVGQYLRDNCDREEDQLREARHILRDQMYRDGGCKHMCSVIDDVFKNQKVAELRKDVENLERESVTTEKPETPDEIRIRDLQLLLVHQEDQLQPGTRLQPGIESVAYGETHQRAAHHMHADGARGGKGFHALALLFENVLQ